MNYDWDFSGILYYLPAFKRAVLVTIQLAVLSSAIGTILGIPVAAILRSNYWIRIPVSIIVEIVRAIPNLVLIFFFYYFPYKDIFGIKPLSPFNAVLYALIAAQAAYSAEVIRSHLDQVPRSQRIGLRALGFKEFHVHSYVTFPYIVKTALPAHIGFWIGNLRLTSLASVIAVRDVVYVAKVGMAQNYRSLEAWTFVAIIFVILVLPVTYLLKLFEKSSWIKRK